jgi:hypothetical protein
LRAQRISIRGRDSRKLRWVSTLALVAVIGILFRKIRWVVLPLAVVHATLAWTRLT